MIKVLVRMAILFTCSETILMLERKNPPATSYLSFPPQSCTLQMLMLARPVLVNLHHCDKMPEQINLKEERLILNHGYRGFSPWLVDSIVSGI
jgi:hypothetical protein